MCEAEDNSDLDGLRSYYDLIVIGTGITESIVACAAARSGKLVLHLDANEFYGSNYSTHSLDTFLQAIHEESAHTSTFEPPVEVGTVRLNHSSTLLILEYFDPTCECETHPACDGYQLTKLDVDGLHKLNVSQSHPSLYGYGIVRHADKSLAAIHKRKFNLSFPGFGLLHAGGRVVDNLVKAGVADYLEFQLMDSIYYIDNTMSSCSPKMIKVPCSKGDVFKSTLLNVLEKRRLMKFLQFVLDWGRSNQGTDVETLNEVELAQGRSLHRPQNKETHSNDESLISLEGSFVDLMDKYQLSSRLKSIVTHALCLLPHDISCGPLEDKDNYCSSNISSRPYSCKQGLSDLFNHLSSLGRFGESGLLSPMFGIGELPQAFCRMAAVWGATYILRRTIVSMNFAESSAGDEVAESYASTTQSLPPHNVSEVTDSTGRVFKCGAVVCGADIWPEQKKRPVSILSHTAVYTGALMAGLKDIVVFPPYSGILNNPGAVYITQLDSASSMVPDSMFFISLQTEVSADATVKYCLELVSHALQLLHTSQQSTGTSSTSALPLLYATTLRPLFELDHSAGNALPVNVKLCGDISVAPSVHALFDRAQVIFESLYPTADFLAARPVSDDLRRDGGEGADERVGQAEGLDGGDSALVAQEGIDGTERETRRDTQEECDCDCDPETERDFLMLQRALDALGTPSDICHVTTTD